MTIYIGIPAEPKAELQSAVKETKVSPLSRHEMKNLS